MSDRVRERVRTAMWLAADLADPGMDKIQVRISTIEDMELTHEDLLSHAHRYRWHLERDELNGEYLFTRPTN